MAVSAPRDANSVPTLMGVSSSDGVTPVVLWADPTTHRLLTQGSGGAAPVDATYITLSANATLTNERVLTGTANQITITDNGAGSSVVLSLPQSIATSSTPTFASMTLTGASSLTLGTASSATGQIILRNSANANTLTLQAGATSGATVLTFPVDDGANGEVLTTNGSGVLSWVAAGGSGTVTDVSVVTANGVSGSVATSTTTPAITLTLGAITPTTVNGNTITTGTGVLTLGAGKTLTATNTLTLTGTDGSSVAFGAGGTVLYTASVIPLTVGTTTIASGTDTRILYNNAGVLGEYTLSGTGTVVAMATSPVFTTPNIGVATATSVNGLTITSSTGTFTLTNAKTLAVTNTLTLSGTDGTTMTFPTTTASIARTDAGQTFTGVQVFTSPDVTTSLTTGSTTFSLVNATATTVNFAGAATTLNMAGGSGAAINLGGGANAAELRFLEPSGGGTSYVALKAPALGGNVTLTLPDTDGDASQVLTTDGSGVLSWATPSAGTPRFVKAFGIHDTYTTGREYVSDVTGSGAIVAGNGGFALNCNATNGSRAAFYAAFTGNNVPVESVYDDSPEIQAIYALTNNTSSGHVAWIFFGGDSLAPTQATGAYIPKHLGFISDTAVLYASNANATTQTTTDISSGVTLTGTNVYRAVQSGSTNIKFYVNKTLKATHTTNLPSGTMAGGALQAGIYNDSGVGLGRTAQYGGATLLWNAE